MVAVDSNILVYSHRAETPQYEAARALMKELAEGPGVWGLPVFTLSEFLRVITHPSIFRPPSTPSQATASLESLLSMPFARVLFPGDRFPHLLAEAVRDGQATGNLVFDAQIVAVCREHGVDMLWSNDRDFLRFPGLRVKSLP